METKLKKGRKASKKSWYLSVCLSVCLYGQSVVLNNHVDNMTIGQLFALQWQRAELLFLWLTFLANPVSTPAIHIHFPWLSSVVPWAISRPYLEKDTTTSFQTRSNLSFFSYSVIRRFTACKTDVVRRSSLSFRM
jgi:hypothetical protein